MKKYGEYVTKLREYAIMRILREIPFVRLNGHRNRRLPGNMNFSFQFVDGENLQVMLDMKGICVSTGSACSSGSLTPSEALLAIGINNKDINSCIRITLLGKETIDELNYFCSILKKCVEQLRSFT